jgi:hypothetical protein
MKCVHAGREIATRKSLVADHRAIRQAPPHPSRDVATQMTKSSASGTTAAALRKTRLQP